jgi:hypothetical protein
LNLGLLLDVSDTSGARCYADVLVDGHLQTKLRKGRKLFWAMRVSLRDMVLACNKALNAIESGSPAHRDGEYWERWVVALTREFHKTSLPIGVSNDKRSPPSPFTRLVGELQACVPKDLRRFCHSKEALAKAIHRTRKRHGTRIGR